MRRARRRRRLSMTSLIDVIFLLLLFFMLTSTFSRFSEVELAAASAGDEATPDRPPLFLQLGPDEVTLNARPLALDALTDTLRQERAQADGPLPVIVALRGAVSAQRLADLLVTLGAVPGLTPTLLGAS